MSFFIVVLSYNHPEHTARAIESALKLTSRVGLVHNGSEASHRERIKSQFPEIAHWEMYPNRGYSGGANFALRSAFRQSVWVIFLTNDCEILNLPSLPSKPEFVAPTILKRKSENLDSIGGLFNVPKAHLAHCRSDKEFAEILSKNSERVRPYIPGSAFLIHKEVFEKTGPFVESLGTYWEDVDFSLRAQDKDFNLTMQSAWKIRHKVGKTCHRDPHYTTYLYQRNRKRVSLKHANAIQTPIVIFYLLRSWLLFGFRLARASRWVDLHRLLKAIID